MKRISFSSDGTKVATSSDDKTGRIWDVSTGQELHQLQGHEGEVRFIVFSPDGTKVATASSDKTGRIWDVSTGQELRQLRGHEDEVWGIVFSPDGTKVATASYDETARIWQLGDIENLKDRVAISCDWVRHYLVSKPEDDADRRLCEGVGNE